MPQCCQCNASGRCRGCVCAKNKRVCISCTPGRSGRWMLYPTQLKVVSSQQRQQRRQQRRQEQLTTSSSLINAKKMTSEKPRVLWRTMALTTITTIEELTRTQTMDWNISPYLSPCSPLPFDGEQSKVEHLLGLFKTATRR